MSNLEPVENQKEKYPVTQFRKNAAGICGQVFDGAEAILTENGSIIADLRGVEDGGLPEDGNYEFVAVNDFSRSSGIAVLKRIFSEGKGAIVKGRSFKDIVNGVTTEESYKKNMVVMTPPLPAVK